MRDALGWIELYVLENAPSEAQLALATVERHVQLVAELFSAADAGARRSRRFCDGRAARIIVDDIVYSATCADVSQGGLLFVAAQPIATHRSEHGGAVLSEILEDGEWCRVDLRCRVVRRPSATSVAFAIEDTDARHRSTFSTKVYRPAYLAYLYQRAQMSLAATRLRKAS